MTHAQPQILVAGDLFFDLVMSGFSSSPQPGEEAFAGKFSKEIGGGAAITACGLAKLGCRAGVAGVVGKSDGAWMLERLGTAGVDTQTIRQSADEPTAFTVSISTAVDRTFFTYNGANREFPALLNELRANDISGYNHVHLAHAPDLADCESLVRDLRRNGKTLSADVGWHPSWYADARSTAVLRNLDIFFPNEREAEIITGHSDARKILESFDRMKFRRVALKLGGNGAALLWEGEFYFQEPSAVESVDATGAGDCFDAGFLYAWLSRMPPASCLRAGVACGELSTRELGGIAGFPSKQELETMLCQGK